VNFELLILAIPFGYFLAVAGPLAVIDLKSHRLPNVMTLPGVAISITSISLVAVIYSKYLQLIIAIGIALLVLIIGYPLARAELLGMGDIKLVIGFALPVSFISPMALLIGVAISLGVANLFLLPRLIARKLRANSAIPLGPYLLVGLLAVFGFQLWQISPVVV